MNIEESVKSDGTQEDSHGTNFGKRKRSRV
jgi:hypothetical protein